MPPGIFAGMTYSGMLWHKAFVGCAPHTNRLSVHWKDTGTLRKAIFAGLCLLSVFIRPTAAATSAEKVVLNRGDGTRARAIHRIPLYTEAEAGEKREKITAETSPALPFSMRGTCSECHVYEHTYDVIRKGWHFNATEPNVPAGRPGQPWIHVDAATGTQIPLSYRAWPGTFRPGSGGDKPVPVHRSVRPADAGRRTR